MKVLMSSGRDQALAVSYLRPKYLESSCLIRLVQVLFSRVVLVDSETRAYRQTGSMPLVLRFHVYVKHMVQPCCQFVLICHR